MVGDWAPIAVVLLCPGRDGKTRGVVEVDVVKVVPCDVGVHEPKERRISGGCWGHDGGYITCDVGICLAVDDDPRLGFAGVDAANGTNSMFGVGEPIKCVQIIKIMLYSRFKAKDFVKILS